jgi:preprotein translocase subunit Sss1
MLLLLERVLLVAQQPQRELKVGLVELVGLILVG